MKEGAPGGGRGGKVVYREEDIIRRNEKHPSVLAGFQMLPSLGSQQHAVHLSVLAEHAILSAQAFPL